MHKFNLATALFCTMLAAGTSTLSYAGESAPTAPVSFQHHTLHLLKGLDLTDAQKEQVKQLVAAHRSKGPDREKMQAMHQQMKELAKADTFDEPAVRILLEKQQTLRLEHDINRLKLMNEVRNVLTAEQKAKLDERMDRAKHKAKQRRQGN